MSTINKDAILSIEDNSFDIYITGVEILLKLLDNVIREPGNSKYRMIRLENKTIKEKLLNVNGMKNVLLNIGFIENANELILPPNVLIGKIKKYREFLSDRIKHLENNEENSSDESDETNDDEKPELATKRLRIYPTRTFVERTSFPKLLNTRNSFLQSLEYFSDYVMQYNDLNLLKIGKSLIPIDKLTQNALIKLRNVQKAIISKEYIENEPCLKDLILIELVNWFNTDFFEWVNSISCKICKKEKTQSSIKDEKCRIEIIQCCNEETKFYRYNDISYLLQTRRGRCGEYANCFTFLCKCLGYDARYIHSTFDHVWTEVYSIAQKRWIHIDPSDNVFDSPLMYESGWKRQVDYVIAFSIDDIQDVTWRYTSNHKKTLSLRKSCSENELLNTISILRNKRQMNISEKRKRYLNFRNICELFVLMVERIPSENEKKGRSSGSLAWRQQRGEERNNDKFFVFSLNELEIHKKQFNLRYSGVKDVYERYLKDNGNQLVCNEYKNWINCTFNCKNIFKKIERDWKMTYLAREEGTDTAEICWKFDFTKSKMLIKNYSLRFDTKSYENGNINLNVIPENGMATIEGSSKFSIIAKLSGGKGDIAWQHTQLFRQNLNSEEYPFDLNITFL